MHPPVAGNHQFQPNFRDRRKRLSPPRKHICDKSILTADDYPATSGCTPSDADLQEILKQYAPFDLVISDMAPRTTGIKFTDQARSYNLAEQALHLARKWLKIKGNFIARIFLGPDVQNLVQEMKKYFTKVKQFKPRSSRAESKEMFLVGLGYKGEKEEIDGRT